jgi:hypothetical protein
MILLQLRNLYSIICNGKIILNAEYITLLKEMVTAYFMEPGKIEEHCEKAVS